MRFAWIALALLAGCFLPVATGAPEPATTVGKGHVGAMVSGEAPTIDLIADNGAGSGSGTSYTDTYGASPAAAMRFTLSYGISDDTDIEAAAEGELWFFFFPLPTGGSIGLRHHLSASDVFDFAVAGRVGGVSAETEYTSGGSTYKDGASAEYVAFQAVVQTRHGIVRPMAALNIMPFNIKRTEDSVTQNIRGFASSATFGLMLVGHHAQFGPYISANHFYSTEFSGGTFASGGLMLAIRPDRNREEPAPPPMPPPAPYPYGPAPPAYPPPAPPPAPVPPPEPAPPPT